MRILFAEDDRDLNNAVKTLLTRSGYQVDAVFDGEEALDYARAEAYDGVILDWMMPEMDGLQALSKMRAEGIKTPCLLLTARDAVEDRVAGLDAGADDYLPKPFNAQELLARVRAMLRRRDAYVPDVVLTVVDHVEDDGEIARCRKICEARGLRLRVRPYEAE